MSSARIGAFVNDPVTGEAVPVCEDCLQDVEEDEISSLICEGDEGIDKLACDKCGEVINSKQERPNWSNSNKKDGGYFFVKYF
jgi:hypothetical protein